MKIIYDFQIFSLQKHGGISRYIYEMAKLLSQSPGVDAKILAPLYVNSYLRGASFVKGMYLPKSPRQISGLIAQLNVQFSSFCLKRARPQLVHETYYSDQRLAPSGARTVLTVYDMIHEKFPALYPNDTTPRLKAAAVQAADHIICISEQTKTDLISMLGVDEKKISVTLLGSDFISRKNEILENSFSFPYILFVGPRAAHKNFKSLLAAYSHSPKLMKDFKIVCFGGRPFAKEEFELMHDLGVSTDLLVHAGGDDRILPTLYAHAAVFVYPSVYEGFGIPLLEAMSLDCAVACSNAGSIPEVVGEASASFSPDNTEEIKFAVEEVLYSSARRAALVAAGRLRAQQFTWEACAEKTKEVYRKII